MIFTALFEMSHLLMVMEDMKVQFQLLLIELLEGLRYILMVQGKFKLDGVKVLNTNNTRKIQLLIFDTGNMTENWSY